MTNPTDETNDNRRGDKTRVRNGPYAGQRGIIQNSSTVTIELVLDSGEIVEIASEDLTNYSRAARRAWAAMPKKSGRPVQTEPRKKHVSVRINTEVWEQLGQAVEHGWITSREEAINNWLQFHVNEMEQKHQV